MKRPFIKREPSEAARRFAAAEVAPPRADEACCFCEMAEPGEPCARCGEVRELPRVVGL